MAKCKALEEREEALLREAEQSQADRRRDHEECQQVPRSLPPLPRSAVMRAAEVREALEANGRAEVVMAGEITATCPKKGCWMDVASGEDTVFVRFLDYGFFVPTEGVDGKQTVMKGEAFFDTLSVAELRHYAEDAGEDSATIAAITKPELQLAFTATGVMIAP